MQKNWLTPTRMFTNSVNNFRPSLMLIRGCPMHSEQKPLMIVPEPGRTTLKKRQTKAAGTKGKPLALLWLMLTRQEGNRLVHKGDVVGRQVDLIPISVLFRVVGFFLGGHHYPSDVQASRLKMKFYIKFI